jgi:hypothetical protein
MVVHFSMPLRDDDGAVKPLIEGGNGDVCLPVVVSDAVCLGGGCRCGCGHGGALVGAEGSITRALSILTSRVGGIVVLCTHCGG